MFVNVEEWSFGDASDICCGSRMLLIEAIYIARCSLNWLPIDEFVDVSNSKRRQIVDSKHG